MAAYVALLRGIAPSNPKMHNTHLRRVFEGVGLDEVRTVISSGNVVFASPDRSKAKLEARIEEALADHLGAPCQTIVRSRSQIEKLLRSDVFDGWDDAPTSRLNVTFVKDVSSVGSTDLPTPPDGSEIVAARDGAVFTVIDTSKAKTPALMAVLEKAFDAAVTTRTWKTVGRISAAFEG